MQGLAGAPAAAAPDPPGASSGETSAGVSSSSLTLPGAAAPFVAGQSIAGCAVGGRARARSGQWNPSPRNRKPKRASSNAPTRNRAQVRDAWDGDAQDVQTLDLASIQRKMAKKEHRCAVTGCKESFETEEELEEHGASHGDAQSFQCDSCMKLFSSVGSLRAHKKTHLRFNALVCTEPGCGKSYATAEGLRLHVRNHHEISKPWVCTFEGCRRSFVRQTDLRLHLIRIHSDTRPFPCTVHGCPKSFACYSELKRHLSSHNRKKRRKKSVSSLGGDESDSSITFTPNRLASGSIDSVASLSSIISTKSAPSSLGYSNIPFASPNEQLPSSTSSTNKKTLGTSVEDIKLLLPRKGAHAHAFPGPLKEDNVYALQHRPLNQAFGFGDNLTTPLQEDIVNKLNPQILESLLKSVSMGQSQQQLQKQLQLINETPPPLSASSYIRSSSSAAGSSASSSRSTHTIKEEDEDGAPASYEEGCSFGPGEADQEEDDEETPRRVSFLSTLSSSDENGPVYHKNDGRPGEEEVTAALALVAWRAETTPSNSDTVQHHDMPLNGSNELAGTVSAPVTPLYTTNISETQQHLSMNIDIQSLIQHQFPLGSAPTTSSPVGFVEPSSTTRKSSSEKKSTNSAGRSSKKS